jgi:hypothetical protein
MGEPVKVALTQLVLWYDATRIQTWPAFLAEVPPETSLKSPTDFGRRFASKRMTDDRHAAAEKLTRNLPGLEEVNGKLILRGVGLLDRKDGAYRVSTVGRRLAEAYTANKGDGAWVGQLARLLITREPRTRVIFWLLVQPGAGLTFAADKWFGGSLQKAHIESPGMAPVAPFSTKNKGSSLRVAVAERAWWALGGWREHALLRGATDCQFVGQLGSDFSLHDVGLALRAAFEVLLHFGALRADGGRCWADLDVVRSELGSELEADFGIERPKPHTESLPKLLDAAIERLKSDTGYVIASELRDELHRRGVENPDREIAKLEAAGVVRIEAEDYGQRRHGVGLYSDPRKQLIKIRVVSGGHPL